MADKNIIIVPNPVVKKIDANRGDLTRVEFIDFCIDTLLHAEEFIGAVEEETVEETYVTREEFARLKQSLEEKLKPAEEPAEEAPAEVIQEAKPEEPAAEEKPAERIVVEGGGEVGDYVNREDFEEFKGSIIQLQKAFINFFTTYGLELGGKPSSEEQRHFKDEVKKLLEME